MTDITKLPNQWRKELDDDYGTFSPDAHMLQSSCADELEALLPTWTRITDSPDSLPPDGEKVLVWYRKEGIGEYKLGVGIWSDIITYKGDDVTHWRPLIPGIDNPPNEQE